MRVRAIPSTSAIVAVTICAAIVLTSLLLGMSVTQASLLATALVCALLAACGVDLLQSRRAWQDGNLQLSRYIPAAFAIGVERSVKLTFTLQGSRQWRAQLHDHADASLIMN